MSRPDEVTGGPGRQTAQPGDTEPGNSEPVSTGAGGPVPERRASAAHPPAHSHGHHRGNLLEWLAVAVVAVIAALLIRSFVFEAFFIPSASMEPTLYPGYRVVVNRLSYDLHSVHTGDIVVFRRPPSDTSTDAGDLIKRVIALPGQTLYVHNCAVYINGKELAQPYLPNGWQDPGSEYCTTWDGDDNLPNPYTVPKGDYFVMGDNRTNSDDSRFWGPLPGKYIVGRAFIKIWPISHIGFL